MPEFECEVPRVNAADDVVAQLIRRAKTIAVVGCSPNPARPSHFVAEYLIAAGYEVIPINPGHKTLLGRTCYRSVLDVPGPIDIVDVFRRPEAVPEVAAQAIRKKARALWLQSGVVNNAAAADAAAAGLIVVQNKCLKVEHAALA